jgi:hypothetical protein
LTHKQEQRRVQQQQKDATNRTDANTTNDSRGYETSSMDGTIVTTTTNSIIVSRGSWNTGDSPVYATTASYIYCNGTIFGRKSLFDGNICLQWINYLYQQQRECGRRTGVVDCWWTMSFGIVIRIGISNYRSILV